MNSNKRAPSEVHNDQRSAILARSEALFASRGFPSTSMNDVAEASGLSKATLYHYFSDKEELLQTIAEAHVSRLLAVVKSVEREDHPPQERLRQLIAGFMREYETAHDAHRVLTQDVRFLQPDARDAILAKERKVVAAFASALAAVRPELRSARLDKPLTMLLFGMINWMFTWVDAKGRLSYDDMAELVTEVFFGGFSQVSHGGQPRRRSTSRRV